MNEQEIGKKNRGCWRLGICLRHKGNGASEEKRAPLSLFLMSYFFSLPLSQLTTDVGVLSMKDLVVFWFRAVDIHVPGC